MTERTRRGGNPYVRTFWIVVAIIVTLLVLMTLAMNTLTASS
jgi:hypothetical protein